MSENIEYPFNGRTIARINSKDRDSLSKWCHPYGVFAFANGYKVLHTMFFYRCSWLRCLILPKTMQTVEQYSCVPYVRATEHKTVFHTKSDFRYPSEYAQAGNTVGWYVTKTEKIPLSVVIKNPKTSFDSCAFGDGDEDITFFLDFDSEYDVSKIKSRVTVYKYGDWDYINGIPTPK